MVTWSKTRGATLGFVVLVAAMIPGALQMSVPSAGAKASGATLSTASAAAITLVEPSSGSVSGGTGLMITVNGLGDLTTLSPQVTIGGGAVPSGQLQVMSATEVLVTTSASPNRAVGAVTVTVSDGAATAVKPNGFIYRPSLEAPRVDTFGDWAIPGFYASLDPVGQQQLVLGDLATRSQGKAVTVSGAAPVFTVDGIEGTTPDGYRFQTDYDYMNWQNVPRTIQGVEYLFDYPGWLSEGTEVSGSAVRGIIQNQQLFRLYFSSTGNGIGGRDGVVQLMSYADCGMRLGGSTSTSVARYYPNVNPVTGRASYCTVFGPEVYSEPFYATADQVLAFDWGAQAINDHYEVYAFLVSVDDPTVSTAIPTRAQSSAASTPGQVGHHTRLMYGRGNGPSSPTDVVWITSTGDIPVDGHYRFRFVNGSYDATGGYALGARMNIDPTIIVGLNNEITLDPDPVTSTDPSVALAATSGGPVAVRSTTPTVCAVNVTGSVATLTKLALGTCSFVASSGAYGTYAPAPSLTRSFPVTAIPPAAPTVSGITSGPGSLSVAFTAGADNGSPITQYQFSPDGGATWTTLAAGVTTSPLVVRGLLGSTTYDVVLRAVNAGGPGPKSNQVQATTDAIPILPPPPSSPPTSQPGASSTIAPQTTTTVPATTTTVSPSTSGPVPVPVDGDALPQLPPGASLVLDNGVPSSVEVTVRNATELVLRGEGFEMSLAGECSLGCAITTTAEGRQVLTLEQNGLARVEGEGFKPGTPVFVWLFSDPRFLGELTVQPDGTFAGSVPLSDIETGDHTLQVNGTSADDRERTANLGVVVSPAAAPTPQPTALPATGTGQFSALWALVLTGLGGALVWAARRGQRGFRLSTPGFQSPPARRWR